MSTIGSLFDGSGGFPLAGRITGFAPVWASEVEPYPIAVTRAHIPEMAHCGDVCWVNGAGIPPVDVITFGSPCQDLSVAGKRKGMRHEAKGDAETTRSGLFLEAIRIIREMRGGTNGRYPAFAVWENVPGAFSSKKGEDFRAVLGELCSIVCGDVSVPFPPGGKWLKAGEIVGDGFSAAWRVLDAQYWGVPQRRKRIYLVFDFRGGRASKILFDPESLPWDTAAGPEAREGAAANAGSGADLAGGELRNADGVGDGGVGEKGCGAAIAGFNGQRSITGSIEYAEERAPCLNANQAPDVVAAGFSGGQGSKAGSTGWGEEVSPTLRAADSGSNRAPCVCIQGNTIDRDAKQNGSGASKNVSFTLNAVDRHAVAVFDNHAQDSRITVLLDVAPTVTQKYGTGGGNTPLAVMAAGQENAEILEGLCPTLSCNHEAPIVAGCDFRNMKEHGDLCGTLQAKPNGGQSLNCIHPVRIGSYVRRMTPLECSRLQGFPDGWADIEHKDSFTGDELAFWREVRGTYERVNGRKERVYSEKAMLRWYNGLHTGSAEYRMWGNGIALPCAVFVLRGIRKALKGGLT